MLTLVLVMAMAAAPAQALQYDVEEPDEGMFAPSSSVEEVIVVGGGPTEQSNIDRSKNASLAPPSFGSPDSYQPGTGEVLIPHVAYDNYVSSGSTGTGNFSGSNIVGARVLPALVVISMFRPLCLAARPLPMCQFQPLVITSSRFRTASTIQTAVLAG